MSLNELPLVSSLDAYQAQALTMRKGMEHDEHDADYLTLQLCSEAGEVGAKLAKYYRDGGQLPLEAMKKELGDVLWYVAVLASWLGVRLSDIANGNLNKLADRKARGVLGGSGDDR